VDGGPDILQWSDSTGAIDDRCGRRRDLDEKNRRRDGIEQLSWSSERGQPKRVGGKYDVDALTFLTAKMDAMTQKLDKLNVNAVNSCAPYPLCDRCGALDHVTENCQVGNPFASPMLSMLYM